MVVTGPRLHRTWAFGFANADTTERAVVANLHSSNTNIEPLGHVARILYCTVRIISVLNISSKRLPVLLDTIGPGVKIDDDA